MIQHNNIKRSLVVLLALLTAGCGGTASVPVQKSEHQRNLNIVWEKNVGDMSSLLQVALTSEGTRICAISQKGEATFYNTEDGERQFLPVDFPTPNGDFYTAGAGCDDDVIAAVSGDGWLRVYSATEGSVLWQQNLKTRVFGAPLLAKGRLFVIGLDGRLLAYTLKRGRELWRYVSPLENLIRTPLDSSLVLAGDTLYAGIDNGAIVALDQSNGRVRWENAVSIPRGNNAIANILDVTTPVVYNNTVCAAAYQSGVSCFDSARGERLWHYPVTAYTRPALSGDGKVLFITDIEGGLYALRVADGTLIWRQKTAKDLSAPLVIDDNVIVGDSNGQLHAFYIENGEQTASFDLDADKIIYLLAMPQQPGNFFALSTDGLLFRVQLTL